MPITQDRMIRLIRVAQDYRANYESLIAVLNESCSALLQEQINIAQFWEEISMAKQTFNVSHETIKALAQEETHFKLMAGRNILAARRQARKRGTPYIDDDYRDLPKQMNIASLRDSIRGQVQTAARTRVAEAKVNEVVGELGQGKPVKTEPPYPQGKRPNTATTTVEDQTAIVMSEAPEDGPEGPDGSII